MSGRTAASAAALSTLAASTLPHLKSTWDTINKINREYSKSKSIFYNVKGLLPGSSRMPRSRASYRPNRSRKSTYRKMPPYTSYAGAKPQRKRVKGIAKRNKRVTNSNTKSVRTSLRKTNAINDEVNRILGPPPNTMLTKYKCADNFSAVWTTRNQSVLYSLPLIDIPYDSDEQTRNARTGGTVVLKAVRAKWNFSLIPAYIGAPQQIRWAIILNRNADTSIPVSVSVTDFFKKNDQATLEDIAENFAATDGVVIADCREINPDKYLVIREGRMLLDRNSIVATDNFSAGGNKHMDQYATVDEYIPLNTQVRFDANTGETYPTSHNLFFVYWSYPMNKQSTDTSTTTNAFRAQYLNFNYFVDIQ